MPPTAMPPPSPRPDHGSTAARPPARPPARALSVEGGWGCAAGGLVLLQLGHEAVARLVRVQAGAGVGVRVRVRVRVGVWLGLGLGLRVGVGVRVRVTAMHGALIAPSSSSPMAAASSW